MEAAAVSIIERERVQILRSRLQASYPQASEIDDATLRRFLRARSLSVEKACKFLLRHLQWRHSFVPLGRIQESDIANELEKEKVFIQGTDKKGRPIGVILARRHEKCDRNLEEFKRAVVYGLDKAISCLPDGQEKFVMIADLTGFTYKNIDVKGYLAALEILQDHYPERLGKLFMLHVPPVFSTAWKILYPFIDPNVREKIVFVEDKHVKETLLKDIDITQLPIEYGGQLSLVPLQKCGQC